MKPDAKLGLSDIDIDPALQPRVGGLDADHVNELQAVPDSWPPLAVAQCDGKHVLVDGFHRYAAAQNLGLESVPVKVVEAPDGDLFSLAFALNAVHGRPLNLSDRRAYAERLLTQNPDWADREIGRRCGLSQPTVAAVRSRLEETAKIEQTDTRIGAGGYIYKVGTNQKQRQAGELPEANLPERPADAGDFTPAQRMQHRQIAHYLVRLAAALEDGDDLEGWSMADDAAYACKVVLGPERARELAERLGRTSRDVLDVAERLGYRETR